MARVQRTLFRSLGVFSGGFALPELEGMCAAGQESQLRTQPSGLLVMLHRLIGKSLVRAETLPNGEQRFSLLETIREFALAQLRAAGEEALVRERHYTTYLHWFRTGDGHLRGAEAPTWFARLELEQENLRAALQWALDTGRYADAAWLLVAINWFWYHRGQWYEQGRWIAQLLPHRHLLTGDLRLAVLLSLWTVERAFAAFEPADQWDGEVMQLLEVCPHPLLHAAAWRFIAGRYHHNLPKAADAWERFTTGQILA